MDDAAEIAALQAEFNKAARHLAEIEIANTGKFKNNPARVNKYIENRTKQLHDLELVPKFNKLNEEPPQNDAERDNRYKAALQAVTQDINKLAKQELSIPGLQDNFNKAVTRLAVAELKASNPQATPEEREAYVQKRIQEEHDSKLVPRNNELSELYIKDDTAGIRDRAKYKLEIAAAVYKLRDFPEVRLNREIDGILNGGKTAQESPNSVTEADLRNPEAYIQRCIEEEYTSKQSPLLKQRIKTHNYVEALYEVTGNLNLRAKEAEIKNMRGEEPEPQSRTPMSPQERQLAAIMEPYNKGAKQPAEKEKPAGLVPPPTPGAGMAAVRSKDGGGVA